MSPAHPKHARAETETDPPGDQAAKRRNISGNTIQSQEGNIISKSKESSRTVYGIPTTAEPTSDSDNSEDYNDAISDIDLDDERGSFQDHIRRACYWLRKADKKNQPLNMTIETDYLKYVQEIADHFTSNGAIFVKNGTDLRTPPYPQTSDSYAWETAHLHAQTIANLTIENQELRRLLEEQENQPLNSPSQQLNNHNPSNNAKPAKNNISKSNNPVPIVPTRRTNKTANPDTKPSPTNPMQRHHPSRLIIHLSPMPKDLQQQHPGQIVSRINNALTNISPAIENRLRVKGLLFSGVSSTPILIAADGCTAAELELHEQAITSAMIGSDSMVGTATARADRQRFEVCIDQAPIRWYSGDDITADDITSQIQLHLRLDDPIRLATSPRYCISRDKIQYTTKGTILVSFHDQNLANMLLKSSPIFIGGTPCRIRPFVERNPIVYCQQCSSLRHRESSRACKGPRCEQCASENHSTSDHPVDTPLHCINCGGEHASRSKECPTRSKTGPSTESAPRPDKRTRVRALKNRTVAQDTPSDADARPIPPRHQKTTATAPINNNVGSQIDDTSIGNTQRSSSQ